MIPDFVFVLTRPFSTTKPNIPLLYAPSAAANLTPRREWIKFVFSPVLGDHTLMLFQHYNTKHRFACPKCNEVFTTQAAMDLVLFSPTALRLDFFICVCSTSMRGTSSNVLSVVRRFIHGIAWIRSPALSSYASLTCSHGSPALLC